MAKTKQQKEHIYQGYKDSLTDYQTFVMLDMASIKTQDIEAFKNKLGETSSKYVLVKNTIFKKALEEVNSEVTIDSLEGSTGVVFTNIDPSLVLKEVMAFLKTNTNASIKMGIIDSQVYDSVKMEAIAALPTKAELIARVVGATKSPLYSIVNVLNGAQRNFVYALKALEAQKAGK